MKVFISFNWPIGKTPPSFTASAGMIPRKDEDLFFNLGISPKGVEDKVFWLSDEPVSIKEFKDNNFQITGERGDRVVIESYLSKENKDIQKQIVVDTEKEWPADAMDGTMVEWTRTY